MSTAAHCARWNPTAEFYDIGRPFPEDCVVELFRRCALLAERRAAELPLTVFEPGCGTGRVLVPLAKAFPAWRFIGIDSSPLMLQVLEERASTARLSNIELRIGDIEAGLPAMPIDIVLHSSVLHAVKNWRRVLHNLLNLLTPDGLLCLIGDYGDLYDQALARPTSPGTDVLLEKFWSLYREARATAKAPSTEASQVGCHWDLESSELVAEAIRCGFQEWDRTAVNWQERFTIDELLRIIEERCYSSIFSLDEPIYSKLICQLKNRLKPLHLSSAIEEATSRHSAVARFLSR